MDTHDYLIDHSGFDWKNLLGSWEWLLDDDMEVAPWLVSRFGDLFFVDELGIVNWLNISDGEVTEVASSEAEFIELLDVEDNAADWFLMRLVDELSEADKTLGPGQCYGFRSLPVLGGELDSHNVDVISVTDYWAFCGHIHAQLDGLPDGTEVDIDMPERGVTEKSRRSLCVGRHSGCEEDGRNPMGPVNDASAVCGSDKEGL